MARVACPLPKHQIASKIVFFAFKSLFDTSRIQKSQHLRLLDTAFGVLQPGDAQNGMRHQFDARRGRSSLSRLTDQASMQTMSIVAPTIRRCVGKCAPEAPERMI